MTTYLTIFRRFPTTFRRFPKIFQNCSESKANVSEHFRRFFKDYWRFPKISEEAPMMFRSYRNISKYFLRDYGTIAMVIILILAKHIWKLKDYKENYKINWSIISSASAYNNISKRCNLCLTEKLHIIKADKACNLNRRNELISKCRHENKYFLMNIDLRL